MAAMSLRSLLCVRHGSWLGVWSARSLSRRVDPSTTLDWVEDHVARPRPAVYLLFAPAWSAGSARNPIAGAPDPRIGAILDRLERRLASGSRRSAAGPDRHV